MTQSHWSSRARTTAVESVVKYGCPIPQTHMTTLPFSRWWSALRRIKSSATLWTGIADITRTGTHSLSIASPIAIPLMIIPSIHILSPVARSNHHCSSSIPRNIFPPPTTITTSSFSHFMRWTIFLARNERNSGSIPYHCFHWRASHESFNRILFGVWYFFINKKSR